MRSNFLPMLVVAVILLTDTRVGFTQQVLLYQNSFESPLITPIANCGPDLDATFVNTLWGGTGLGTGGGGSFQQINTVETILITGPDQQYIDPTDSGGNYCLSMLATIEDDRAALTLNSQMLPFANISFLMSPINIAGCGGPLLMDTATMHMTVYDSPGGTFSFSSPGNLLDEDTIVGGAPGLTDYTFNWLECNTSLDIANSVDGNITIVFDLIRSPYAAIDNIKIVSSVSSSIEDHDLNNITAAPNPFIHDLVVNGTAANGEVIICDVLGKEILRQKTFEATSAIATQDLHQGIYILTYLQGNIARKITVVKF